MKTSKNRKTQSAEVKQLKKELEFLKNNKVTLTLTNAEFHYIKDFVNNELVELYRDKDFYSGDEKLDPTYSKIMEDKMRIPESLRKKLYFED